jgi:hypothetical protein
MDIIYIIVLALCLLLILSVILYLIFMVPAVTASEIKYVDCPDYWVNTSNLNSTNKSGCYVKSTDHASYGNIGLCKTFYNDNDISELNYCSSWPSATSPTITSNYNSVTDPSFVGLSIEDINATSECNKLKWAALNRISWNGITNNYNLLNGCIK